MIVLYSPAVSRQLTRVRFQEFWSLVSCRHPAAATSRPETTGCPQCRYLHRIHIDSDGGIWEDGILDEGGAAEIATDRSTIVAVVVPAYRVRDRIVDVVGRIGPEVDLIHVVDDACPEHSGEHLERHCTDSRLKVLRHDRNQGVGGAVISGYRQALEDGADIVVKLDGDGQMDPALIPRLILPIREGSADYTKGNRFWNLEDAASMPRGRLLGNIALSFFTKFSSGYWNIFDPTNGFTAIHAALLRELPLHKISQRYFFESDMLFRVGVLRGLVIDVPMVAVYGDEPSSLRIRSVALPFLLRNLANACKRIVYRYFLRDFSIASVQLVAGLALVLFGTVFGVREWVTSVMTQVTASTGTVMLAALPVILGVQMLLSFLSFDVSGAPTRPVHPLLRVKPSPGAGRESKA